MKCFQTVFAEIMTLLIALEFNHTLQYVVTRQQSIIQTSVCAAHCHAGSCEEVHNLVADSHRVSFCLAAATLALGATYWLLRESRPTREQAVPDSRLRGRFSRAARLHAPLNEA